MSSKFIFFLTVLIFSQFRLELNAQDFLSRKVSFEFKSENTGIILSALEKEGGFIFSYNADLIDVTQPVSLSVENNTIQFVLDKLICHRLSYKVVGTHIVLQENKGRKEGIKKSFRIEGFVINQDGEPLENAIIYEINRTTSAITKSNGKYVLKFHYKVPSPSIHFDCRGYRDTLVNLESWKDQRLDMVLQLKRDPREKKVSTILSHIPADSIRTDKKLDHLKLVSYLVPTDALYVSENLNVYEKRVFQISFLPFLGTNYLTCGLITNNVSLNIVAGYSAGLNGFELGSVANIVKGDIRGVQWGGVVNVGGLNVHGMQMAGVVNTNLGKVTGFQMGGVANIVQGSSEGVQISGVANVLGEDVKGMQMAGVVNATQGDTRGFQIGGIGNVNRGSLYGFQVGGTMNKVKESVHGLQVSGIVNIDKRDIHGIMFGGIANLVKGSVHGVQLAGITNIASKKNWKEAEKGWAIQLGGVANYYGGNNLKVQLASIYNNSSNVSGLQLSGISNRSKGTVRGLQFSSFYNRARKLKGLQVGMVNFADTIESGFPLGLVNILRHGYRRVELGTDETSYIRVSYKTGGRNLYSTIGIGMGHYLQAGYGAGFTTNTVRKYSLNFDLTASAVFDYLSGGTFYSGLLPKAQIGLNYKVFKNKILTIGPSFNIFLPHGVKGVIFSFREIGGYGVFYGNRMIDKALYENILKIWCGWHVGIRL